MTDKSITDDQSIQKPAHLMSKYSSYQKNEQNSSTLSSEEEQQQLDDQEAISSLDESDQNIEEAIKRFSKLIKQRDQIKQSITQQLKRPLITSTPDSTSLTDFDNEGEILKKIHKNQQALPFSASPFKRAKAPSKTRDYYIKLLRTKLQHIEDEKESVFLSQKEFLLQEITDIARYMDYEDCNCHIIPALKALVNSGVIIIQRLLTRLPDLADVIINELSGHPLKGLAFVTSQIFPIIEASFLKDPIQNSQSLAQCIDKLIKLNDHDILRNNIQNMIMKLYSESFQTMQQERQIGSLVLLENQQILDIFTPNKLDQFIKSQMKLLASRCISFKLQKALIPFICSLSKRNICMELFQQFLYPVYIKYLKDEQLWGLRKVAIQGVDSIAKNIVNIGNFQWIEQLMDYMDDGLKSESKWVRIQAFKIMPKFLVAVSNLRTKIDNFKTNNSIIDLAKEKKSSPYMKKPTSQNLNSVMNSTQPLQKWKIIECRIVNSVLTLVEIAKLNKDNIIYNIAYNFPSLIYLTSNSGKATKFWQQYFYPLHRKLSTDSDFNIKRTIASSLHQVAKLVIQNNQKKKEIDIIDTKSKSAYFIELVSSFLSDLDEVQAACLRQLPSLLKLIASDTILDGTPKQIILFLFERYDTRMITQVKSEILPELCQIFLADVIAQLMEKSYLALIKNENWLVRKNSCKAFGPFYLRMQKWHRACLAGLNQSLQRKRTKSFSCSSSQINSDDESSSDDNDEDEEESKQNFNKNKFRTISTKNGDGSRRYSSIAAQSAMEKYCNPLQFSDKYQERISYIWMIQSLVRSYIRKGMEDDAISHMEQLISLKNDRVVCVRLAIVTALYEIKNSSTIKKCDKIEHQINDYMNLFSKDESLEIKNICKKNLGIQEPNEKKQSSSKMLSLCDKTHIYNQIDPLEFRFIERELEFTTSHDFQLSDSIFLGDSSSITSNFQDLLKQAAKLTQDSVDVNAYLKKLASSMTQDFQEEKKQNVIPRTATASLQSATPVSTTITTTKSTQNKVKPKEKQPKTTSTSIKSHKSQQKAKTKKQEQTPKSQHKKKQSPIIHSKSQRHPLPPSYPNTARPLSAYSGKASLYKLSSSASTRNPQVPQASRINSASSSTDKSGSKQKSLSHQNSNRGRFKLPVTNLLPPLNHSKKQNFPQRSKFMRKYSQQQQPTSQKNPNTLSLSASTTSTTTSKKHHHHLQQIVAFSSNKQNIKKESNSQFK